MEELRTGPDDRLDFVDIGAELRVEHDPFSEDLQAANMFLKVALLFEEAGVDTVCWTRFERVGRCVDEHGCKGGTAAVGVEKERFLED